MGKSSLVLLLVVGFLVVSCDTRNPFSRGISTEVTGSGNGNNPPPEITPEEFYNINVKSIVEDTCVSCHPGQFQSSDYTYVRTNLIVAGDPEASFLYIRGAGLNGHSVVFSQDEDDLVVEWIMMEE